MRGFPDVSSSAAGSTVARRVRRLRRLSNREANREHRWDLLQEVPSGWAHVQAQTVTDRAMKFFYNVWQHLGTRKAGRSPGEQDRLWGGDRPGDRSDYLDGSATREDRHDRR